jgi:hypothetical protein
VDGFNQRRLLEPIGNISPAELAAAYYHSTGQQIACRPAGSGWQRLPMAARLEL